MPCSEIHGGCFPEEGGVSMGSAPYYSYTGAPQTPLQAAAQEGWTGVVNLTSMRRAQVELALRDLADNFPAPCAAIANQMRQRLAGGFLEGSHSFASGQWLSKGQQGSIKGIIILRNTTGPNEVWKSDGTYDPVELRRLLAHEGIHMWFDTDIGHVASTPQWPTQAYTTMKDMCGALDSAT